MIVLKTFNQQNNNKGIIWETTQIPSFLRTLNII